MKEINCIQGNAQKEAGSMEILDTSLPHQTSWMPMHYYTLQYPYWPNPLSHYCRVWLAGAAIVCRGASLSSFAVHCEGVGRRKSILRGERGGRQSDMIELAGFKFWNEICKSWLDELNFVKSFLQVVWGGVIVSLSWGRDIIWFKIVDFILVVKTKSKQCRL